MSKRGGRRSKEKGNRFERLVSTLLTEWVTGKKYPLVFWRIGSSGAHPKLATMPKSQMFGDIVAIEPEGRQLTDRFVIECKHHKGLKFQALMLGNSALWRWWNQVSVNAALANKEPMLIFKVDRSPIFVVLPDLYETKFAVVVKKQRCIIDLLSNVIAEYPRAKFDR